MLPILLAQFGWVADMIALHSRFVDLWIPQIGGLIPSPQSGEASLRARSPSHLLFAYMGPRVSHATAARFLLHVFLEFEGKVPASFLHCKKTTSSSSMFPVQGPNCCPLSHLRNFRPLPPPRSPSLKRPQLHPWFVQIKTQNVPNPTGRNCSLVCSSSLQFSCAASWF
jgi:hypothetical protein